MLRLLGKNETPSSLGTLTHLQELRVETSYSCSQSMRMNGTNRITKFVEKVKAHIVPPQVGLIELLSGYWVTAAISTAARLKIADHLQEKNRDVDELAEILDVNSDALLRLLRALASVGILKEQNGNVFSLTSMGDCLCENSAKSLRDFALLSGSPTRWAAWNHLQYSIRSGKSSFEDLSRVEYFDFLKLNPQEAETFKKAMSALSKQLAPVIGDVYDFSNFRCVVDLGGGEGHLLAEILKRHSKLEGICFDLPEVVGWEGARKLETFFDGRLTFLSGDFFHNVPVGADCYLLKNILHDWDDESCLRILKHVHSSMGANGRLVLVESVLEKTEGDSISKFMDLEMLVLTRGGRERSYSEFLDLLKRAGFEIEKMTATPTPFSLLTAKKIQSSIA